MTMDAGSLKLIHRLIAVGSSSLMQYVCESFPWYADPAHAAQDAVVAMAAAERDDAVRLSGFLAKRHLDQPAPATYPSHFTTTNFCSLDYLLPKLVAEEGHTIAEVTTGLASCGDETVRGMVQGILDRRRQHLDTLKALAAPKPAAVPV